MSADYGRIKLPAGSLLFAEGDRGATAFLVQAGALEIFLARPTGEIVLARRGPGEIVGEMALIDARPRSASVRVAADCELVVITADRIAHRLSETDPILRMCLGVVIERYREMVEMVDGGDRRKASRAVPHAVDFTTAIEALSVESELTRAVTNREFEIHYQPIVRLPSHRLAGFEALLRWRHPTRGLIGPGAFIALAEASGLISDITAFCIDEIGRTFPAILEAARANDRFADALFISINISGHDLAGDRLVPALETMLERTAMPAGCVKLEVTESVLMKDPARAVEALERCRGLGLQIAVDDFGTGYSSLSYLSTLPINVLKIDGSFIRSMTTKATSLKIIQMVLKLADELAIPVVAEGIEDACQAELLAGCGCAFGQGYLFGRPAPYGDALAIACRGSSAGGTDEAIHAAA